MFNLIFFLKDTDRDFTRKGRWYLDPSIKGRTCVSLLCFTCGEHFTIFEHGISNVGRVTPSVVCPHGCGFHQWITLRDWGGEVLPEILAPFSRHL